VRFVEHGALRGVLGEDGEGAAVVIEIRDGQPIVRDESLELGRKLLEELPRIERVVHRPPDGGQTGHEVGEDRAGVVSGAHRLTTSLPSRRIDFALPRVTRQQGQL
jgi:hypothetical protein